MQEIEKDIESTSSPIVELESRYTLDQLPVYRLCDECGGHMESALGGYRCNNVPDAKVVLIAENVPVLRCVGECGGSYYPYEVLADLVGQAIPVLQSAGEEALVDSLYIDLLLLRQAAQQDPILLDPSNSV